MTDNFSEEVIWRYFQDQAAWTLHIALCLACDLDPDLQKEPLSLVVDDGRTTRLYRQAMVALKSQRGILVSVKENQNAQTVADYWVERDNFVEWMQSKKGLNSPDCLLVKTWRKYKESKQWGKLSKAEKQEIATAEIRKVKGDSDFMPASDHKVAEEVHRLLTKRYGKSYAVETIRKLIPEVSSESENG